MNLLRNILKIQNLILVSIFVLLSASTNSQSIFHLKFHHFNTNNGLGSTNVRKSIQDLKGFTWIATQDGLYRFDGNRFDSYNKFLDKKHAITGSDIRDLVIIRDTLWAINSFGGI